MNPHIEIKRLKQKYSYNPEATQALEDSYEIFSDFSQQLLEQLKPTNISKIQILKVQAEALYKAFTLILETPSTTPEELEEARTICTEYIRDNRTIPASTITSGTPSLPCQIS